MNKEEAFEFISRMDWMHPKMKEACKVVEHELFRPKQEPPMINHKGLKEVMKFVVKKYVVFEGLVNPLVDQIMKTIQDHLGGLVYHFDYPNGEPNKEAYVSGYDDLGKPIIEQKPFQINCSPIEEEKRNSGCFEKVYIYVPITDEYKVLNKSASDGKIFYRLALKKEIPKEFMILDGAVYHSGAEVTKQVSEIVMKLINDYEAGLGKGGEKKDEPEGTLFLADDLKVFGVSYDHENKCVIYSYFNRGEFEKVTRHSNGEFTYKGIKLGDTTTNKLKDCILDYWTNCFNK